MFCLALKVLDRVIDVHLGSCHEIVLANAQDVIELIEHFDEKRIESGKVVTSVSLFANANVQLLMAGKVLGVRYGFPRIGFSGLMMAVGDGRIYGAWSDICDEAWLIEPTPSL